MARVMLFKQVFKVWDFTNHPDCSSVMKRILNASVPDPFSPSQVKEKFDFSFFCNLSNMLDVFSKL